MGVFNDTWAERIAGHNELQEFDGLSHDTGRESIDNIAWPLALGAVVTRTSDFDDWDRAADDSSDPHYRQRFFRRGASRSATFGSESIEAWGYLDSTEGGTQSSSLPSDWKKYTEGGVDFDCAKLEADIQELRNRSWDADWHARDLARHLQRLREENFFENQPRLEQFWVIKAQNARHYAGQVQSRLNALETLWDYWCGPNATPPSGPPILPTLDTDSI